MSEAKKMKYKAAQAGKGPGSGGSKPKVQGGYLRSLLNYSDRF